MPHHSVFEHTRGCVTARDTADMQNICCKQNNNDDKLINKMGSQNTLLVLKLVPPVTCKSDRLIYRVGQKKPDSF